MHFFGKRQTRRSASPAPSLFLKLKAGAAVSCLLLGTVPSYAGIGFENPPAQNSAPAGTPTQVNSPGLPPEPAPNFTQPLFMRPSARNFGKERGYYPNPLSPYKPTSAPAASFVNSPHLQDLLRMGPRRAQLLLPHHHRSMIPATRAPSSKNGSRRLHLPTKMSPVSPDGI